MQIRSAVFNFILAFVALSGCASTLDRVAATRPNGGVAQIFDHPYEIVFPAATRVMHLNNEIIGEADPDTGRIITLRSFQTQGIYITQLANGRTRVELSANMSRQGFGTFPGGPAAFFVLLREQVVVFTKKKVREKILLKKKRVDKDLRTTYKPKEASGTSKEVTPTEEPTTTPTRRQRLRLRR